MSTQLTQLPPDKTPAQRARIKLYEQFGVVFLVNAALAAYVLLSSQATGAAPNWLIVIVAAIAQGVLALFNALEKYFSANNQPLYSAMFDAARQEVASKAPSVTYNASQQALQQSANAAFAPTYTYNSASPYAVVTPSQSASTPSSLKPTTLVPAPAPAPNTPPANASLSTTVPGMPAVQP